MASTVAFPSGHWVRDGHLLLQDKQKFTNPTSNSGRNNKAVNRDVIIYEAIDYRSTKSRGAILVVISFWIISDPAG